MDEISSYGASKAPTSRLVSHSLTVHYDLRDLMCIKNHGV